MTTEQPGASPALSDQLGLETGRADGYVLGDVRELRQMLADCEQYLKEGETPAQRIERERRDTEAVLNLLIREKRKNERMREALQQIAQHFSSEWPERCQEIVRRARAALAESASPGPTPAEVTAAWVPFSRRLQIARSVGMEVDQRFNQIVRMVAEYVVHEHKAEPPPSADQPRPALVTALRGLLASLQREPTEFELRAAAHEFTVMADRAAVAARAGGDDA